MNRWRLFTLSLLVVLGWSVTTPLIADSKGLIRVEARTHQRSKNVAIVVGVEKYDQASSGLSPLQYAADDAVKLATVFSQNRYVVKRLVDQQAGKHQILATIRNAAKLIDPKNSTLVFSFSGHGFAQNGKNYLMAAGSTIEDLANSALSLDDVIKTLRQSGAKRILLFIDACRNIPGQKSLSRGFTAQNGQGVQVLYSTKFGSVSWESPRLQQGVFSHFLVKGIQGEASQDDNIVDFSELAKYVESKVSDWSFQHLAQPQQPFRRSQGEVYGQFVVAAKGRIAPDTDDQERLRQQREQQLRQQRLQQEQAQQRQRAQAQRQRVQQQAEQRRQQQRLLEAQNRRFEPEMRLIKGGTFTMGSPASEKGRDDDEKPHSVRVGDFYLGKTEVTVGEFKRFVQAKGYRTTAESTGKGCRVLNSGKWEHDTSKNWKRPGFTQSDNHPVTCVSFDDAAAYAQWLSGLSGKRYNLPTEAQWEYAARAGTQSSRYWGDNADQSCGFANVADQSAKRQYSGWTVANCNDAAVHTAAVGRYRPNGFGLYDMLGNVLEWTCSEADGNYAGGKEQRCLASGSRAQRALRGGSWFNFPRFVRSADRGRLTPTFRGYYVGFRLSRTS